MNILNKNKERRQTKRRMSATQILVIGFFAVISVGTLLLMLPVSSRSGEFTSLETAYFTAVSATCITGLIIEDTVLYWSGFGQAVILAMIQIGGLGFMTVTVLISMLVKRTITPRERLIIAQSLGLNTDEGTVKLVRRILGGTLIMELGGAVVLSTQFVPLFGWRDGLIRSIFHAVSAFCNAGFDLMGEYSGAFSSLAAFRGNYVVNITIMTLIVVGGIGFIVWDDAVSFVRRRRRFSVYSKFILIITAILIFGGGALIFLFERGNPATFRDLPLGEQIIASLFQSVTTRTAGFATTDNTLLTDLSKVLSIILMFIGGASGSTAGGVKVGTVGLLIYAVFRVAAGSNQIVIFKRRISNDNVLRAMTITAFGMLMAVTSAFVISAADGVPFLSALYETASAGGTVGVSLSLTPALSTLSHCILMLMMFLGRIGILTFTYSIMLRITNEKNAVTYCETQMLIG